MIVLRLVPRTRRSAGCCATDPGSSELHSIPAIQNGSRFSSAPLRAALRPGHASLLDVRHEQRAVGIDVSLDSAASVHDVYPAFGKELECGRIDPVLGIEHPRGKRVDG